METNIENKLHIIGEIIYKIITPSGSGSGFYLKKYNVIVTNYHVVGGFKQVAVEDSNKNRYLGKIILINYDNDLAFIKIEANTNSIIELELGEDSSLNSRDEVYVLGYPFGLPYTITKGIISSKNQLINGKSLIQTDAAVNPGNSGGAMIDKNGKLIGVTVSKFVGENTDNMGFGIPIELLIDDLESLKQKNLDSFCIKCNSCKNLIFEKSSFCKKCGNSIKKEIFDELPISSISIKIEKIIESIGINPIITRTGQDYWTFHYENKFIKIYIDEDSYISIISPIFKIHNNNLEEFYRYSLSKDMTIYKLGITDDEINLLYTIHISDLLGENEEEYIENMKNFFSKLKQIIKEMKEKFNTLGSKYDKK